MNRHRRSHRCTCRASSRGWRYRGQHHMGPGAWTVDDVRKSLRPKETGPIFLSTVMWNAKVYGIIHDHDEPQMITATLTIADDQPALVTLPALVPTAVSE